MALLYRVVAFGTPRGPWRGRRSQAESDAVAAGLAVSDPDGHLYWECFARLEWRRAEDFKQSA